MQRRIRCAAAIAGAIAVVAGALLPIAPDDTVGCATLEARASRPQRCATVVRTCGRDDSAPRHAQCDRAGVSGIARIVLNLGDHFAPGIVHAQEDHRLFLPDVRRRYAGGQVDLRLASQVGGYARAVVADGRRAWAGIGPRLVAFELDADDKLRLVGASEVLPGTVRAVTLLGNHAYAVVTGVVRRDGYDPVTGVYAFEVAAAGAPRLVGVTPLQGDLEWLVSGGGRLFLADEFRTLRAINVDDPARPRETAHYDLPYRGDGVILGLEWVAEHLYVLQYDLHWPDLDAPAIVVLGVGDPDVIRPVATVPLSDAPRSLGRLEADGDRLYWLGNPLTIWSLVDPANPVEMPNDIPLLGSATVVERVMAGMATSVADTTEEGHLLLLDVTDPMSATILGGVEIGLSAADLSLDDGFVFAAGNGVWAADVRVPSMPAASGSCRMPGWTRNVAVGPAGLFVPDGPGMWVWNDPAGANAACARHLDAGTPGVGPNLGPTALSGERGFVAEVGSSPAAVRVVDLSVPGAPRFAGRSADLPFLTDVAAEGDYAFALSERGLHIIDGRDPDHPLLRDSIELFERMLWTGAGIAVRDGLVAAAGYKLRLFDVSDPEHPAALGSLGPTEPGDVALRGHLAFASEHVTGGCVHTGVHVIDVADPMTPRLVAQVCLETSGPLAVTDARGFIAGSTLLFVGDGASVRTYFVPPSGRVPILLDVTSLPAEVKDLAIDEAGPTLWVADTAGGLFGFEINGLDGGG